MDFAFTKDQELIRKSAKDFFRKECPKEKVRELKQDPRGYDPKMWRKMVELGFTGLVIPEEFSGTGGEFIELMIFMEEIGRNIVPSPFFSTVVQCALPIQEYGSQAQKKKFLPGIAENGKIWSLAQIEQFSGYDAIDIELCAACRDDVYVLNGTKLFVSFASCADYLLVVARTDHEQDKKKGLTFFIVDARSQGIDVEIMPTTACDMRCEVRFNDVEVPAENILGEPGRGRPIVEYIRCHSAILKAAEMSGGAQAVLDIAVRYAGERIQFGKSIGSFQAVQFKLVDLLTQIDGLRCLVHEAAWKINHGSPSRKLISMAKAQANKVYHDVCFNGIFIHGAIGWTEEMDIGLYHLLAKSLEFEGGSADFHREIIAAELERNVPEFVRMYS
jgi:alkylation response protein AidB-like acyl-CoA dehydrogenase